MDIKRQVELGCYQPKTYEKEGLNMGIFIENPRVCSPPFRTAAGMAMSSSASPLRPHGSGVLPAGQYPGGQSHGT